MLTIRVRRYAQHRHGKLIPRQVTLRLDGHTFQGRCTQTWARSIANNLWGPINNQEKMRVRLLPGPTWWFSCSGHGGYVMIAPTEHVAPWLGRFIEDGQPVWQDAESAPRIAAYVFEEDCDWAVLYAAYPDLLAYGRHKTTLESVHSLIRRWQPQDIKEALSLMVREEEKTG